MRNERLARGAVVGALLLWAGCNGSSPQGMNAGTGMSGSGTADTGWLDTSAGPGPDDGAGFSCEDPESRIDGILRDNCVDSLCHGSDAVANLDFFDDDWRAQVIGQPTATCEGWIRVVPGDPEASFVYQKLFTGPACGTLMPPGMALSDERIACVAAWIEQLAAPECETCGGEACLDLMTDAQHCGACNAGCPEGIPCEGGSCACPDGTTHCGDACVNIEADGLHCGACDNPCDPGLLCNAGSCTAGCGALTECGGGCVDTTIDPMHCGGCDQPCPLGAECMAGACSCPGPEVTYTLDIEPIFVDQCTGMGCHGFPVPQLDLDLREGAGYADMVGVASAQCAGETLVVPGSPDDSYLMNKLLGVDMCLGTRMPKAAPPLSGADTDLVASWICKGAPE